LPLSAAQQAAVDAHAALAAAHGATGAVVGTTNPQTLNNKTLSAPVVTGPTGIVKGDVGLANVDNTPDAIKPISTATQAALNAKSATGHPHSGADITDFTEAAQDIVGAMIVGAGGTYNDATGAITLPAVGGGAGGIDPVPTFVSGPSVATITAKGATISWSMSENTTGNTKWGTATGVYPNVITETALLPSHSQIIGTATASTPIFGRVYGVDSANQAYQSAEFTFTTAAASVVGGTSAVKIFQNLVDWQYTAGDAVNWQSATDWMIFSVGIDNAGGLVHHFDLTKRNSARGACQAAGKRALLTIGGVGRAAIGWVTTAAGRETATTNIAGIINGEGFDGLTTNFEEVMASADVNAFVTLLRSKLNAGKKMYAEVRVNDPIAWYAPVIGSMDGVNLMTFNLQNLTGDGATVSSCHNALYRLNPSVEGAEFRLGQWEAAGIPRAKLSFGAAHYWRRMHGRTAPGQTLGGGESLDFNEYDYKSFQSGRIYHAASGATYIAEASSFLSADDPQATIAKLNYAKAQGYGGMIVWYYQAATGTPMHSEMVNWIAANSA